MTLRLLGISTVAGFVLYAASYAPYLRYEFGADWLPSESEDGFVCVLYDDSYYVHTHTFYRPIEIIIDRTPCKKFFLIWSKLWDVRFRCEFEHRLRQYDQS